MAERSPYRWCMAVVSSCREMLGQVLQRARPPPPVAIIRLGTLAGPPPSRRRRAGTTSSHHAPYALGCTRATMAGTEGCHPARGSGSRKAGPSSDWGLQPAPMKSELLVIADQHAAVNAFPGLVHTARHTTRVVCTRSRRPNREGGGAEGVEGEGGEVVTR